MSWQQLLPWLACHAVPDWLYVGLIVPNVGPSVRLIVPSEQLVPNDISDWTPTPMDSSWPRRYQSGRCYCQKHFSFFEAFMIWYTHHSWKKLEGNHFKNLWETKIFGLVWFWSKTPAQILMVLWHKATMTGFQEDFWCNCLTFWIFTVYFWDELSCHVLIRRTTRADRRQKPQDDNVGLSGILPRASISLSSWKNT